MWQFVNGRRAPGSAGNSPLLNPASGEPIATLDLAGPGDVDAAVTAARAAYPAWSTATPAERSAALTKLAAILAERADELAASETSQTGKPIRLTTEFDVPGTVDNVAFFAGAARSLEGKAAAEYSGAHTSMIRREPIGVIGSIAPWNYPLQMAAWKVLPAIAAGNTIVLKPAEITPCTALLFAEAARDAGLPDGVVNVLTGRGSVMGEALIRHPGVAMVSFTGSTEVGRRVMKLAAGTMKRVHLELGGKAPFVVYDDADLSAAVEGAVAGSLINAGQDCTAATRAYVHSRLYDAFVDGVAQRFSEVRIGDPTDPETDMGSLSSSQHRDSVSAHLDRARGQGAKVIGGGTPTKGWDGSDLTRGAYVEPALVVNADQASEIVQHEVFGPVLTVLPFDTDDEAIALANDTPYGLAASVWTRDVVRALRGTREINAGCVWVNDHIPIVSEMPHGGVKGSGFGKDMSAYSFEEYTQVKHVMIDTTGGARKPWHRTVVSS